MKEKARSDPGFFFAVIDYDAQTKKGRRWEHLPFEIMLI